MKFELPKHGKFQKFHGKKYQRDLERIYDSIERLKKKRISYILTPHKKEGLTFDEMTKVFFHSLLHRIISLSEGGIQSWNNKYPLLTVMACRSIIEATALASFFHAKTKRYKKNNDLHSMKEMIHGFMMSYPGTEYRRKLRNIPSISRLIDYFDKEYLKSEKKLIRNAYDFISNFVHTNWPGTLGFFSHLNREENKYFFNPETTKKDMIFIEIRAAYFLVLIFEGIFDDLMKIISIDDSS